MPSSHLELQFLNFFLVVVTVSTIIEFDFRAEREKGKVTTRNEFGKVRAPSMKVTQIVSCALRVE